MDKYTCENCGGVFEKGLSDEDVKKEQEKNGWGDLSEEETAVVCDDCYNKIMITLNQ